MRTEERRVDFREDLSKDRLVTGANDSELHSTLSARGLSTCSGKRSRRSRPVVSSPKDLGRAGSYGRHRLAPRRCGPWHLDGRSRHHMAPLRRPSRSTQFRRMSRVESTSWAARSRGPPSQVWCQVPYDCSFRCCLLLVALVTAFTIRSVVGGGSHACGPCLIRSVLCPTRRARDHGGRIPHTRHRLACRPPTAWPRSTIRSPHSLRRGPGGAPAQRPRLLSCVRNLADHPKRRRGSSRQVINLCK